MEFFNFFQIVFFLEKAIESKEELFYNKSSSTLKVQCKVLYF